MTGKHSTKRLKFESLEDRRVMAGLVSASAIGGVLTITGNSDGNGVVIHNTSPDVIEVLGIDQAGSATQVNSQSSASFTNIKTIVIDMKGGDNAVVITDLELLSKSFISVAAGSGNDFFGLGQFDNEGAVDDAVDALLGAVSVNGGITINAGIGNNTVVGGDVITKTASFSAGAGNDTFKLEGRGTSGDSDYIPKFATSAGLILDTGDGTNNVSLKLAKAQTLTLRLGDGDDHADIQDVEITKGTTIAGKDGVNTIAFERVTSKSLDVSLGIGNDDVTLEHVTIAKGTSINGGFGNDSVAISNSELQSLAVSLGIGNDELSLNTVTVAKAIDIAAGDGDDEVVLDGIVAASLSIALGAGTDTLSLNDVAIAKTTSVNGGDGNDTVDVDDLGAKKLAISLGKGNDGLTLKNVPIVGKASIDGGKGENSFADLGNVSFGQVKRANFPTI